MKEVVEANVSDKWPGRKVRGTVLHPCMIDNALEKEQFEDLKRRPEDRQ